MASIFNTVSTAESGNQNVLTRIQPASGPPNTASGFFQITDPTWRDFAPRAGVDINQFPTAMSTGNDYATQARVASFIPLNRFAQPTQNAVTSAFGPVDNTQTLGVLDVQHGGAGIGGLGAGAGGPAGVGTVPGGGQFGGAGGPESNPFGSIFDPGGSSLSQPGIPGVTSLPAGSNQSIGSNVAQAAGVPGVLLDQPFSVGLTPGLASAIGNMFNAGVVQPIKGIFATLENWIPRALLIIVGLGILAVAMWRLLEPAKFA